MKQGLTASGWIVPYLFKLENQNGNCCWTHKADGKLNYYLYLALSRALTLNLPAVRPMFIYFYSAQQFELVPPTIYYQQIHAVALIVWI